MAFLERKVEEMECLNEKEKNIVYEEIHQWLEEAI